MTLEKLIVLCFAWLNLRTRYVSVTSSSALLKLLTPYALQYFEILAKRPVEQPWLNITSSATSLDQILSEIRYTTDENPSQPAPMPFLGSDIQKVHEFYENYIRPPSDANPHIHFCNFVYLVIDTTCFQREPLSGSTRANSTSSILDSKDFTILFCSDAPDIGESENEVRLKVLRLPLAQALNNVCCCETLTRTPSEALRFSWDPTNKDLCGLVVRPPPTLMALEPCEAGKDTEYRFATREEARANKRRGIMIVEKTEKERGKPLDFREQVANDPRGLEYWSSADSFDLSVNGKSLGSLPGWTNNNGYTGGS